MSLKSTITSFVDLTESLEKYLLAIYELSKINNNIIVKDIANCLKIGGASASDAIKTLANRGFINYIPYGSITMTSKGLETIELKLYRHNTISDFLNKVFDIDKESSNKNASAIEYSMTEDVLVKFVHFLDFMKQCSCKEPKWINSCKHSLGNDEISKKCSACISDKKGCGSCCGGCH